MGVPRSLPHTHFLPSHGGYCLHLKLHYIHTRHVRNADAVSQGVLRGMPGCCQVQFQFGTCKCAPHMAIQGLSLRALVRVRPLSGGNKKKHVSLSKVSASRRCLPCCGSCPGHGPIMAIVRFVMLPECCPGAALPLCASGRTRSASCRCVHCLWLMS
jgi:hypothetical protein